MYLRDSFAMINVYTMLSNPCR